MMRETSFREDDMIILSVRALAEILKLNGV
jgi:hypothetical protein